MVGQHIPNGTLRGMSHSKEDHPNESIYGSDHHNAQGLCVINNVQYLNFYLILFSLPLILLLCLNPFLFIVSELILNLYNMYVGNLYLKSYNSLMQPILLIVFY